MGNYKITKSPEVKSLLQSIGKDVKESALISGAWDKEYATAVAIIDNVRGKAELHEKMRDVWYILSGKGTFLLGGTLLNPQSPHVGEWIAEEIEGSKSFEITKGDIVEIVPGTAHQIDATGNRLETFLVKIPA